jgi:hypothetical protein
MQADTPNASSTITNAVKALLRPLLRNANAT